MTVFYRIRTLLGGVAVGLIIAAMYLQVVTSAPDGLPPLQSTDQVWFAYMITATLLMFLFAGLSIWEIVRQRGRKN
jgi:hypothetical protein